MELEAEKRGLIVSNILVDGPDAKGVGPSMSVMVQAAEELGRLDDFLELNLLGGKENNSAENQQQFRDVLADVGVEELHKFMPDDFPAKGAIEAISGPAIARMPPDLRSEVQEMIIDSIVTGIVFTDASLNESEPADAPVCAREVTVPADADAAVISPWSVLFGGRVCTTCPPRLRGEVWSRSNTRCKHRR